MERREAPASFAKDAARRKYGSAFSALHPLGLSGAEKKEGGLPGALKNTGDESRLVVPAKAGTQHLRKQGLDSRLRGNDSGATSHIGLN